MKKIGTSLLALSLALLVLPVLAQESQPGPVGRAYFVKPKVGMLSQFEDAYEKHIKWHKQQNDDWTWNTYEIVAGEDIGQFIVATGGHDWEDFDNRGEIGEADSADYVANVSQYVETVGSAFSIFRADVSRLADDRAGIPPLYQLIEFHLNQGADSDFNYAITKIHEAIDKTSWPVQYMWIQRVSGGEIPMMILILPRENWAAFNPQEKPFDAMLDEAYGKQEATQVMEQFSKSVHCQKSFVLKHRPDLSYQPPGN